MRMIGIISNPFSDGNAGRSGIAGFAASQADVAFASPPNVAALPDILRDFARRGVVTLAVDGGDGTVRDVMSALSHGFGQDWPALAILPSGKTNLVARDVGSFGTGLAGLHRLLAAVRTDSPQVALTTRSSLEVVWPDDPRRVVRGFFFGAGIFTHATRMAGEWAHDRGVKQRSAVALTMARTLYQTLRGHHSAKGTPMAVSPDIDRPPDLDRHPEPAPRFLVLATTLQQLMLGFWPFPHHGEGALHWLDVQAPPHRLDRALWAAWRGRLQACPAKGYDGGRTQRLAVRLRDPFVVDGELFTPGANGVIVQAGPPARFISG